MCGCGDPALADKVFVTNEKGNTVTRDRQRDLGGSDEFDAGNRPRGITIIPDGKLLYVGG